MSETLSPHFEPPRPADARETQAEVERLVARLNAARASLDAYETELRRAEEIAGALVARGLSPSRPTPVGGLDGNVHDLHDPRALAEALRPRVEALRETSRVLGDQLGHLVETAALLRNGPAAES